MGLGNDRQVITHVVIVAQVHATRIVHFIALFQYSNTRQTIELVQWNTVC